MGGRNPYGHSVDTYINTDIAPGPLPWLMEILKLENYNGILSLIRIRRFTVQLEDELAGC